MTSWPPVGLGKRCHSTKKSRQTCFITDILMPEQKGLETIREFRRNILHPWLKNHCYSGGGNSSSLDYLRTAKFVGADRTLANLSPREEILEAAGELLQS